MLMDQVTPYIVEAIKGFVRSIVLGAGQPVANILQDTLRLITLWFSYGTKEGSAFASLLFSFSSLSSLMLSLAHIFCLFVILCVLASLVCLFLLFIMFLFVC